MSSTYLNLQYHVIFATKEREPMIESAWRSELHEYLAGTVRGLGGTPLAVGGTVDHVHLLIGLQATHCLADIMRELKKASSIWVHRRIGYGAFRWQEGYAAFTVSITGCEAVRRYILNQESHHTRRSFQDELSAMLERAQLTTQPTRQGRSN